MKDLGTVKLETERLILRRYVRSDYKQMFENWASDEKVTKFMTWAPHKNKLVTFRLINGWVKLYKKPFTYAWTIHLKSENQIIGSINARNVNYTKEKVYGELPDGVFDIGYCIGSKYWGNGYVAEAFIAVKKYLFDECEVKALVARHHIDNPNSGKVMQKAGLKFLEERTEKSPKDKTKTCIMKLYILQNEK